MSSSTSVTLSTRDEKVDFIMDNLMSIQKVCALLRVNRRQLVFSSLSPVIPGFYLREDVEEFRKDLSKIADSAVKYFETSQPSSFALLADTILGKDSSHGQDLIEKLHHHTEESNRVFGSYGSGDKKP